MFDVAAVEVGFLRNSTVCGTGVRKGNVSKD
jgi:hypothetical protein